MEETTQLPYALHLIATLSDLARIRQFVAEQAAAMGIPASKVLALLLAVDEAATNIIVHGYRGAGGPLEVQMGRVEGLVIIRLRDLAPVFDPTRVPPPDLSLPLFERPPGGLGIHLMRQSVDELRHRPRPGGGNELVLVKRGL